MLKSWSYRIGALILGIALAVGALMLFRPNYDARITGCIVGARCDGIRARVGSRLLSGPDLAAIMEAPIVREAARSVSSASIISTQYDRRLLMLVGDVGNGRQAFYVAVTFEDGEPVVLLGSLLSKLFEVKELAADSSIKTMGPLYTKIAVDVRSLATTLQSVNIRQIELVGTISTDVEAAGKLFEDMARLNADRALTTFRPGDF